MAVVQAIEEGGLEEYEDQRRRKAGKLRLEDGFDSQPGTPNPGGDSKRKRPRTTTPAFEKGVANPPEVTKQFKKLFHTVLQHEDR